MAIIYSYPLNDNIKSLDKLVGTTDKNINGKLKTVTRNFILQDLVEFFIVDGGLQKEIILTTNGNGGPSTLDQVTGVLNIPQYAGLQDLQQVTDLGSTTTNTISITPIGNNRGLDIYALGYGSAIVSDALDGDGIQAYSFSGIGVYAYSQTSAGLWVESRDNIPIKTFGNGIGTASVEVNLGNTNKGLVINSGTSSTGNFIELDKNGVDKLVVNQEGELTATKLIKEGGTGLNALLDNGDTVALSSIVSPSALTKVDDTNVTLTLGGTPATSLLQGVSLTLGWIGTLADSRIASASVWNAKQNAITIGTTLQYLRGDLSLATFPTNLSSFTNGPGYITSAALAPYITTVTAAATYEPKITAGTTTQYWRGDKTWQPFPSIGGGDMFKSVYDINDNGIVDAAQAMVTQGRNSTGVPLYKGTIVYISGATGQLPNFVKSQANLESTSAGTFGVVNADIANNANGWVTTIGLLEGLDTRTTAVNPFTDVLLAIGNTIYLHPTIAGYVTNIKPSAPNHIVYIGKVVNIGPATQGAIVYRMQNGYELDEIHDVAISNPLNNQGLFYESTTTIWKNKSIATVLGFTPANDSNVVHKTGAETISGVKTFNDDIIVNGIYINKGSNNANANIAIGLNTLDNTSGNQNTAIGYQAATKDNILGPYPISYNTVVGYQAYGNGEGNNNTAIGWQSLFSTENNNNSALGYSAGLLLTTGFQNTFIGAFAGGFTGQLISAQNSTAIGYNAISTKNNQVVLGNASVVETVIRGTTLVDGGVFNAVDSLIIGGPTKCTQYKLTTLNTAPVSATATGTLGDIRITAGFIYVCTATNTWVRTPLTTW